MKRPLPCPLCGADASEAWQHVCCTRRGCGLDDQSDSKIMIDVWDALPRPLETITQQASIAIDQARRILRETNDREKLRRENRDLKNKIRELYEETKDETL